MRNVKNDSEYKTVNLYNGIGDRGYFNGRRKNMSVFDVKCCSNSFCDTVNDSIDNNLNQNNLF